MPQTKLWMIVALLALASISAAAETDYPVRPVPFTQVKLHDGFWGPRLATNRDVTVAYDFRKCEETGRIDNFAKAGGLMEGRFRGNFYDDSDVYKVIEGASYTLATDPDPKLDKYLDDLIAKIAAAQEPDGYLYTYRTLKAGNAAGPERWTRLMTSHELYDVGHLYEAAVAHYTATGKRTLLDVALKSAELIHKTFGPAAEQRKDPPGHEEIEIGLAKLYRATGDARWLQQAKFFLDVRGKASDGRRLYGQYYQDFKPVVEQGEAVGHAVRATYMYSGMADVAALTGDASYVEAIDRIWDDVVSGKLYVTGGIGARRNGEAFGNADELPNREAYNETCAAIANCLWNHRMFLLHADGKYMDVFERTLYNAFLAGISLEGNTFFYANPLAADGAWGFNQGNPNRAPWFDCSCCPVNVVRFFPSIAGCVYAQRGEQIYVNLFANGEATLKSGDRDVTITARTDYPRDGRVELQIDAKTPATFALLVRIPGWARGEPLPGGLYHYLDAAPTEWKLTLNGQPVTATVDKGYARIQREWKPGDKIVLDLPMPVRRVVADDKVTADRGRVAIERGPIVYCVEGVDHDRLVSDLVVRDSAVLKPETREKLLGGIVALCGAAERVVRSDANSDATRIEKAEITAIPYYAWSNRGQTSMAVWLPREPATATPRPASTLASRARTSASHVGPQDSLAALADQVAPRSSGDQNVGRFTWWDHRGGREWVQYDLAQRAKLSAVEVYWFDDAPRGQCRVPKSWRLLYRDGEEWKPVAERGSYGLAKDQFNSLQFTPIESDGLRIEVELQAGFSGGILEWRVRE